MADRAYHAGPKSLEISPVTLWAEVAIGATGAPTLTRGKGIASVARVSAGNYKLTLSDSYVGLLWAGAFTLEDATLAGDTVGGNFWKIDSQDVTSSTDPNVVFAAPATDDGADAEVADGAVVYFKIELRNSSVD